MFWRLNPHKLKAFTEGFKLKRKMMDEQMWMMGMYVNNAVSVAVEHCLAGKKAKSKYIDKPILQEQQEKIEEQDTEHYSETVHKQVENVFMLLEARKINYEMEKEGKS